MDFRKLFFLNLPRSLNVARSRFATSRVNSSSGHYRNARFRNFSIYIISRFRAFRFSRIRGKLKFWIFNFLMGRRVLKIYLRRFPRIWITSYIALLRVHLWPLNGPFLPHFCAKIGRKLVHNYFMYQNWAKNGTNLYQNWAEIGTGLFHVPILG